VKIAVDPLLYVYQKLGMLLKDVQGVHPTVYLSTGIEDLPLVDGCADLVLCRNALDHMPDPEAALKQFSRIMKQNGVVYLSVDIGGEPTPDEPTVFSIESLTALIKKRFQVLIQSNEQPPHSSRRVSKVRILAGKFPCLSPCLDKEAILNAYLARIAYV
jgi:ubiquinone/menaquinone biosynthesis C-methylase UbiE